MNNLIHKAWKEVNPKLELKGGTCSINVEHQPVYIKGVSKGDLLEINIEKIEPDDHGLSTLKPGFHNLGPSA